MSLIILWLFSIERQRKIILEYASFVRFKLLSRLRTFFPARAVVVAEDSDTLYSDITGIELKKIDTKIQIKFISCVKEKIVPKI